MCFFHSAMFLTCYHKQRPRSLTPKWHLRICLSLHKLNRKIKLSKRMITKWHFATFPFSSPMGYNERKLSVSDNDNPFICEQLSTIFRMPNSHQILTEIMFRNNVLSLLPRLQLKMLSCERLTWLHSWILPHTPLTDIEETRRWKSCDASMKTSQHEEK